MRKKLTFRDKVIFIISQEKWGKMLFSKHHYAIELGKWGNKVYFITFLHHEQKLVGNIEMVDTGYSNVTAVNIRSYLSYFVRFPKRKVYNLLVRLFIPRLIRLIGRKPDIVWSFDLYNSLPIKHFPPAAKIFVPVDGPAEGHAHKAAEGADIIVSVTREILEGYMEYNIPGYFLNHGVADIFINQSPDFVPGSPLHVGYSGCLLSSDLDRKTILGLIRSHPEIYFEFWGEYDYRYSDIHLPENILLETREFVDELSQAPNVHLHGVVETEVLAKSLRRMDILLVCYDSGKNQSYGTNSHKLLEYLGSGKVVVSSRMKTYGNDFPGMLQMPETDDNSLIPEIFEKVAANILEYNSPAQQEKRIEFARQFTYQNQIERIQTLINS